MNDCLGECTPEPGSHEAGGPVRRRWRELRPPGSHFSGGWWGRPQEDPRAAFWCKALLSALLWDWGFSSQGLHFSILWSADERDPAWYRLQQAHPLGQEQPLRAPCGPVCRVSRAAADPAACRSEPPDPPQTARKHCSAFATGTLSSSLSGPGGHGPPPHPP